MFTAAEAVVASLAQYGPAVLLVAFALEGALVGKVFPTRSLLVAVVLATAPDLGGMAAAFAAAVVGATIGQGVLFVLVRRAELPSALEDRRNDRFVGWLEGWGLPAVAVSNALPVARGSLTVPAAMTDETVMRFSASSVAGTAVYAGGLVSIAAGLDAALLAL